MNDILHPRNHRKLFGVTVALIGVLIAFCSAMVGSERKEFMRAMIQQTQSHDDFTAASTKMRLTFIELEKQRAKLDGKSAPAGTESPVPRFIELAGDYKSERNLAKAWDDSFNPVVEAHFEASERYEKAEFVAEVAIIIASLAVLLANRSFWATSLVISAIAMGALGYTYVRTEHEVAHANAKVHETQLAFDSVRNSHSSANDDQKVLDRIDPDGSIRSGVSGNPDRK
jgi:hypothetical protein